MVTGIRILPFFNLYVYPMVLSQRTRSYCPCVIPENRAMGLAPE